MENTYGQVVTTRLNKEPKRHENQRPSRKARTTQHKRQEPNLEKEQSDRQLYFGLQPAPAGHPTSAIL